MNEWKEVKVCELGEIITGRTPSKNHPEEWGDKILFLTPTDYKNCFKYVYDTERKLSDIGIINNTNKVLPKDSIMVTCIGSDMGKVLISSTNIITNQQINSIIVNNENFNSDFLYYIFLNLKDELKLLGGCGGSTMPILNKEDFSNIILNIPSLKDQKCIASILANFDNKIDILHQQNTTLEKMAETLFRQWFIEDAQDDWGEGTLSSIAHQNKNNINPSDFPYEVFNVYSMHAHDADKKPEVCLGKDILSNKTIIEANSILISKLNPQFPRIWIISDRISMNSVSSTEFINIIPDDKNLISFIYLLLTSNGIINELAHSASGTSGSHQRVTINDIFNITFKYPSIEYLNMFSGKCSPLLAKINTNRIQIRTLEQLRDTLLPKLMSGKIRVRCDEEST